MVELRLLQRGESLLPASDDTCSDLVGQPLAVYLSACGGRYAELFPTAWAEHADADATALGGRYVGLFPTASITWAPVFWRPVFSVIFWPLGTRWEVSASLEFDECSWSLESGGWSLTAWWMGGYGGLFAPAPGEFLKWPACSSLRSSTAWWMEGFVGFFSPPSEDCSVRGGRWSTSSVVGWSLTARWIGGYCGLFPPALNECSCWSCVVCWSLIAWWMRG